MFQQEEEEEQALVDVCMGVCFRIYQLQSCAECVFIPYKYFGRKSIWLGTTTRWGSMGCTVTFVQTEFLHHRISTAAAGDDEEREIPEIILGARESGLDIRYATISDGFPLKFDREANFEEFWGSILRDFPGRVDEFLGRITAAENCDGGVPPSFLVADTTYLWASEIAHKYNMFSVSFWTEAALAFSVGYHLDLLKLNAHFPIVNNVLYQNIIDAYEQVKKADFILCNTVQELEPQALSALNQKQPTYAVAPPISPVDCQKWLDSKPHGSVLYISFGSTIETNTQLIHEIAHGLMLSQQRVNFIWILRRNLVRITSDDDDDLLPPGFEDCVGDRGLVIPWCNQSLVLSDPRIGCFLTHCGWNSVLESIWHGVPMICFPLSVDQPTNRKLVVDDWKIGINLCDDQTKQISRQQVAQKIDHLMSSGITSLRREIKKVETILHRAWAADGSSNGNLDRFLHDLKAKTHSKSSAN
ncbi:hypothetical protein MIMGU_mgv11b024665mg [Erythranthe guttata]|uniref:Glycosyltransferase n=1 Tax=Erythranthe guttata TaxID=4155 RepID=A0A022R8R0_ERYGU|nr:hypothetical protein MIMGU_mgv11b024665mg [Erythranthe guttata]